MSFFLTSWWNRGPFVPILTDQAPCLSAAASHGEHRWQTGLSLIQMP